MKSYEKETIQAHLNAEDKCLKDLEKAFKQAKKDCQERLRGLNSRTDMQNLQSIINQKKYQEALLRQIDGVLNDLQTHTYKTANEFFEGSYRDGYIGSMYELNKQGIPLTVPVSHQKMQRAIQTDSKLSKSYYEKQGLSVTQINTLKKKVALEATRGIVSGKSWLEVADSLSVQRTFQIAQSDALRIARTEGNRINQQARLDAGQDAVDVGCDILKQWDSTLDSRTRPAHREADGQIVEWGEKFTVMGEKLDAPSIGGSAGNVCNCRCQLLKRPRWALDDEELETLQKRAEYFGLDKSQSFEDFKKKYLQLPSVTEQKKILEKEADLLKPKGKLDASQFPKEFTRTKPETKNTEAFINYVNDIDGVYDPNVVELFSNMKDMDWFGHEGVDFTINHKSSHAVNYSYRAGGRYAEVKLSIPKPDGTVASINTILHENTHLMDLLSGGNNAYKGFYTANQQKLLDVFAHDDGEMSDEIKDLFKRFHDECDKVSIEQGRIRDQKISELKATHPFYTETRNRFRFYDDYHKQSNKIWKEYEEAVNSGNRNALGGGLPELEDIYDALSFGERRDNGTVKYGHGSKYYKRSDSDVASESLANYSALSVTRPDLVEMLRRDKPEVVDELGKCIEGMLRKVKGK